MCVQVLSNDSVLAERNTVYMIGFTDSVFNCVRPDDTRVEIVATLAEAEERVKNTVLGIRAVIFPNVPKMLALSINCIARGYSEAQYKNRPYSQLDGKFVCGHSKERIEE